MYVVCTYMFMNLELCIILWTEPPYRPSVSPHRTLYIHVHDCKCVYVHSTDTSQAVQLHNHTSLLIRPYQPCDTGEYQLRTGSIPSELPPSESVICLLFEQLVKSSMCLYWCGMYHVHTLHIHIHTVYIHAHTLYMGTTDCLRIPLPCMPVCTAHVRCMYYAIIH